MTGVLPENRMVPASGPHPPFDKWRVQAFHPDYGYAWYCREHTTLVTQTIVPFAEVQGGVVLSDWIDRALAFEREALLQAGGVFLFHDMRSLKGYDTNTRVLVNNRIRQRERGYARRTVIVAEPTPLWRMALQITDLTFALLGVKPATVTGDMARAVQEIAAVYPGAAPPWLAGHPSVRSVE